MWEWFINLPWDAWAALAGIGTFLLGSGIAAFAARTTWLQVFGFLQIALETQSSPGHEAGYTVHATVRNPSDFYISLVSMEVSATERALVALKTGGELVSGPVGIRHEIEPRGYVRFSFYLTTDEGLPKFFALKLRWGRHGPAGKLSSTKVEGRFRPQ